jgi:hypothetical protein
VTPFIRRSLIGLCIAMAALLGVGAQLHGLSHALKVLQSSSHDEPLAGQNQACDQCLQFAAADGQAPAPAAAPWLLSGGSAGAPMAPAAAARAVAFAAYESRAPPTVG